MSTPGKSFNIANLSKLNRYNRITVVNERGSAAATGNGRREGLAGRRPERVTGTGEIALFSRDNGPKILVDTVSYLVS